MIWTWQDLPRLASLGFGYLATGLLPRRWDGPASDLLFTLCRPFLPRRDLADKMRRVLGDGLAGREPQALAEAYYRFYIEDGWGRLRDLHRHGSLVRLELSGREHLDAALAAGHGAVLWVMSLSGSRIPKAALWQAGIPLVHLTRPEHGAPSPSRLALRVLAPWHRRAERRYLADAVVRPAGFPSFLESLRAVLHENRCLSITTAAIGRQLVAAPFLGGQVRFATGAPALAHASGAALLTVYGYRLGRLHYQVVIEPPLDLDRSLPRREYVRGAVAQLARRLESHVIAHPADWQGWRSAASIEPAARRKP
jgi:lauroyl/myristoyl acyltransferase